MKVNNQGNSSDQNDSSEIICIICPNSCHLTVYKNDEGEIQVLNALCKRGIKYGKQEFLMPKRMLITTMKILNGVLPVIPVRSDLELPKERIFEAIEFVNKIAVTAPIKVGKIIIKNILGLEVNVISSRSMETMK